MLAVFVSVVITLLVWIKTRSLSFPIGFFFIYFWSLHGAFAILADRRGREISPNFHFQYLERKLFPIDVSAEYYLAVGYYAVFFLTVQLTILVFAKTLPPRARSAGDHACSGPGP